MSVKDLFYVLQETDLNNQDIYLPADTPTAKANPRRLKAIYKKQHARQRERLLFQQVAELNKSRKEFSTSIKDDIFIFPSETACELVNGPDFLKEHNDQIMEVLGTISQMGNSNRKNIGNQNTVAPEYNMLAPSPPPSLPSPEASLDHGINTSENEEALFYDTEDKNENDEQDDEAIQKRKAQYSAILEKELKKQFSKLRKHHELEYRKLLELQKEDLAGIVEETVPPLPVKVDNVIESKDEKLRLNTKERKSGSFQQQIESRANEHQKEALNNAPHAILRHSSESTQRKPIPNMPNSSALGQQSFSDDRQSKSNMPSNYATAGSKSSTTFAMSKPPTVATSSGPPVVAASSSSNNNNSNNNHNNRNNNHNNRNNNSNTPNNNSNSRNNNSNSRNNSRYKCKTNKVDSNQPLFDQEREMKYKPKTLLDRNGSITIKSKPDRVIINGLHFGAPKDFDDAINGIPRTDNAIIKRYMHGEKYLYHRTPQGKITALGTVSKIQPFIHKFLLSR